MTNFWLDNFTIDDFITNALKEDMFYGDITTDSICASLNNPSFKVYFIARENGLPEMVGKIGTRTAVANNDQIVQAIEGGVARGMSKAGTNSKVVIEATGDTSGLLDFINFKQKERNRQYGL